MKNSTKRAVLRTFHLVLSIPILGYIYQPVEQVGQYAGVTRFVFVPMLLLSGYWMYAGTLFAVVGVAAWLGAYRLSGFGAALLSQIALFAARKIWLLMRARTAKSAVSAPDITSSLPRT